MGELKPLLESGIPLVEALESLALPRGPRSLAARLVAAIRSGQPLGEALDGLAPAVPREHAAIISAGEEAGRLPEALRRVAKDLEGRLAARRRLAARAAYPLAVLALAALLPPLHLLFRGDTERYLLTVSIGLLPLGFLLALPWCLRRLLPAASKQREALERVLLEVPGLRRVLLERGWGSAFSLLGMLLEAGLPFSESFPLAARAAALHAVRRGLEEADRALQEGASWAEAFLALSVIPSALKERLAAAELAGPPGALFVRLGEELEAAWQRRVDILVRLLPVALYLAAGIYVIFQALEAFKL